LDKIGARAEKNLSYICSAIVCKVLNVFKSVDLKENKQKKNPVPTTFVITNRYITVRIKYLGFSDFYLKNGKIL
jgi:hypothetical protein